MHVTRLAHLCTIMEKVIAEEKPFSMATWVTTRDSFTPECGTACCMGGYACLDEEFQRQGLHLIPSPNFLSGGIPSYEEKDGFGAMEKFFDLDYREAVNIFDASPYIPEHRDPAAALARLRRFMEKDQCSLYR